MDLEWLGTCAFEKPVYAPKLGTGRATSLGFSSTSSKKQQASSKFTCHEIISYQYQTYLIAGNSKGEIWKWNITRSSNHLQGELIGCHQQGSSITCCIYHPFYQLFITGSTDCTLKIWDVFQKFSTTVLSHKKQFLLQTLASHQSSVLCLEYFSEYILSGSADGTVKIFRCDMQARQECFLYPFFNSWQTISGNTNAWISCIWTQKEDSGTSTKQSQGDVYIGDLQGNLTILKTKEVTIKHNSVKKFEIMEHKKQFRQFGIINIIVVPYQNLLFTNANDYKVKITDLTGTNTLLELHNKRNVKFKWMDWDAQQGNLYVLDERGILEVYNQTSSKFIYSERLFQVTNPTHFKLHQNNRWLWIGGTDGLYHFEVLYTTPLKQFQKHTGSIWGLEFDEDEFFDRKLISVGMDGKVANWGVDRNRLHSLDYFVEKKSELQCCLFDMQHHYLYTGHENGELAFWNLSSKMNTFRIKAHTNSVTCISLISLPKKVQSNRSTSEEVAPLYLITGGYDGRLALCNMSHLHLTKNTRKPVYETWVQAHACEIICILYNPLDETIISATNNGQISVWDLDLKFVTKLEMVHSTCVNSMTMDGYFLLTAGEDSKIVIWEMQSRSVVKIVSTIHNSPVRHIKMIPQLGSIISAAADGTIIVWDYLSETKQFEFKNVHHEYTCINYDPISKEIFVGTTEGFIVRISTVEAPTSPKKDSNSEEENNSATKQKPASSKNAIRQTVLSPRPHYQQNQIITFESNLDKQNLIEVLFSQINSG